MKKFTLHLDAVLVMVLLFVLSLGFNGIQYFQYKALLKEHVDLQEQALKRGVILDSPQAVSEHRQTGG